MSQFDLHEAISSQVAEVELLQSVFAQKGEFQLEEESGISVLKQFAEERLADRPPTNKTIGFTIRLRREAASLEVTVRLPHLYPLCRPDILVRSDAVDQTKINECLRRALEDAPADQVCVLEVIQRLQDLVDSAEFAPRDAATTSGEPQPALPRFFSRLWIHSHHIYNTEKRRNIQEWARELTLTGWCLPGKPGLVCVEGSREHVDHFWNRLRRLNWQRIQVKHREEFVESEWTAKFGPLQEKWFGTRNGKTADLGLLYEFLKEHNTQHVFAAIFGFEGREAQDGAA